jgi:hypothetical protein
VEIASDGTNTFIAAGTLYLYDGATLSTVATPDLGYGPDPISIAQIDLFFLLQVEDSGRIYWIEPGAMVVDPLTTSPPRAPPTTAWRSASSATSSPS